MEYKKLKLLFEIVVPKYNGDKNNFVQRVNEYMASGTPVTDGEKKRWNDAASIIEQGGGGGGLSMIISASKPFATNCVWFNTSKIPPTTDNTTTATLGDAVVGDMILGT